MSHQSVFVVLLLLLRKIFNATGFACDEKMQPYVLRRKKRFFSFFLLEKRKNVVFYSKSNKKQVI